MAQLLSWDLSEFAAQNYYLPQSVMTLCRAVVILCKWQAIFDKYEEHVGIVHVLNRYY